MCVVGWGDTFLGTPKLYRKGWGRRVYVINFPLLKIESKSLSILITTGTSIRSMRVSEFPSICTSRYGREKKEMLVPDCIGDYGTKAVFRPLLVNGTS